MLNSDEHETFFANKYENSNHSFFFFVFFFFSYLLTVKLSCSAMFNKKEFAIVNYLRFISLLAGQFSCSAELSMKKSFVQFQGRQLSNYFARLLKRGLL